VVELALILAINLGGLSFAVGLTRWLSARDAGTLEVRRLGAAVARATRAFLWRELRSIAAVAALGTAAIFAAHALLVHQGRPFGSFETAFWMSLGLGLGAALAWIAAYAGARLCSLGSVRMLRAAELGMDRALTVAVRASGAAALIADTLSMLGVCALFGLLYAMKGGFALPAEQAGPLALRVAVLLPGFAFGAAAAALVVQRGGSIFHVSGDVGGDIAGERDAGLDHDDARNPAAITDLVGDHVGSAAARACDLFVCLSVTSTAAFIIGASLQLSNRAQLGSSLTLLALPALVRSFGVVASCVGLMVARAGERDDPRRALARGHLAALVVSAGGLAGACLWLVGESLWLKLFAAGAIGTVATLGIAYSAQYRVDRRFRPLRQLLDALGGGDAVTVAQGLALGLQAALLPVLGLGVAMAGAWQLGTATGLRGGGLLGSLIALTTMLATAAYVLAVGNVGAMADSARGVAEMSLSTGSASERDEHTGKLDEAGFLAASIAQTYLILVGCLAALTAAAALPLLGEGAPRLASIDLAKPAVFWSGALGAVFVLAYAGHAISSAGRGARSIALEVERQLHAFPAQGGTRNVPRDYIPHYRSCIELVSRIALHRVLVPVAVAMLFPALLGTALRLMYRSFDPGLWAEGLMSFVLVASVTGLGAALAVDAARTTLGAARRASRPRSNAGFNASVTGDAVADLIGNSAGPAAHLVVKAAAVSSLIVASFLT
jgi:Na+/H+-translocating membrane pyrophosphatase